MIATDLRLEDLPAWMRPRRRTMDWGLLIVLVFCALAAGPLVVRHGIPFSTEAEMVELRSVEVARLVRAGVLFSRWGPDLNYGLGSPLFNYLAPLPHYLPGYHQVITDTSPADSINLFLALSIVAAGSGMYLFTAQRWGAPGGVVGALAYLFSPPIILALPYLKGDLGALMALGILPWVLWAFDHLYLYPQRRNLLLAVGSLSAMLLSDTRVALLGLFILATSIVSLRRQPGTYRHVVDALFAATLLTAFFWLPALAERQDIRWQATQPDTWAGAISPGELLGGIPYASPPTLNPLPYRAIGVGTWALALVGIALLLARRKSLPVDVALFLALGLVLLALSTPPFYRLWSPTDLFLPLLPYHAVLLAVFCLSVVAAQAACGLDWLRRRWRPIGLAVLGLVSPLIALPTLHLALATALTDTPDYLASLQNELRGYHTGTFRDGLLLPGTAPTLPAPLPNLLRDMQEQTFDRISRRSFSAEAQINPVEHSPLYNRYIFDLSQPTSLEFNVLYFPGWSATIDGKPWEVQPTEAGLLRVRIPQLSGELVVLFEGTVTRNLSWALVVAGCAAMLLMLRRIHPISEQDGSPPRLAHPEIVGLGVALTVYAAVFLVISQRPGLLSASGGQSLPGSAPFVLKSGVALAGYTLAPETARPGEEVRLTLFWRAEQPLSENYQSEVALWDSATGQQLAAAAHRHPGKIPTLRWLPGTLVRDEFVLTVPPGTPPGNYAIQAAIRPCDSLTPLPCPIPRRPGIENDSDAGTLPERVQVSSP
jgi:hypothetical protein